MSVSVRKTLITEHHSTYLPNYPEETMLTAILDLILATLNFLVFVFIEVPLTLLSLFVSFITMLITTPFILLAVVIFFILISVL